MCEAGTTELYIDNNGDVYPCPLLKSYSFLYCGNALTRNGMNCGIRLPCRNFVMCRNAKTAPILVVLGVVLSNWPLMTLLLENRNFA